MLWRSRLRHGTSPCPRIASRRSSGALARGRLVDVTPSAQALLDQVLPAVQQIVTATMSPLGDQALHALLDALTAANAALDAAPHDLPPPAAPRPACAEPETGGSRSECLEDDGAQVAVGQGDGVALHAA